MSNGRFSDGFLLGALVGGVAVFLLGTKKGNKILKAITEEGLEGLSGIAKEMERDARREAKTGLTKIEDKLEDINESIEVGNSHEEEGPTGKRFFKKPAKN